MPFFKLFRLSVFLAALSSSTSAATFVYPGGLSGANEVPANGSTATGRFTASLDTSANSLFGALSFSDLSSSVASINLHCCAPAGANAGSIRNIVGAPFATAGAQSRALLGLTNAEVAGIASGLADINMRGLAGGPTTSSHPTQQRM